MAQLSPVPIAPPAGVVKTDSNRVIEGRWSDTVNMRFVKGLPQKIGGWIKGFAAATSGVPRTLHAWRDNLFNQYIAAGTYRKLYVYDQTLAQNDITPYRLTGTLGTNPFTTTSGSPIVTVAHTAHGLNAGDTAVYVGATAVGGLTLNATVLVSTVVDSDHYAFIFSSNATSGATGGGSAVGFSYEIPVGVEIGVYGLGWGVGGYGLGTYGTARGTSTIFTEPRVWSQDHFGQILLASYNGGSIYKFDPTAAQPWGRGTLVDASAPANCRAMFVTPERYVLALLDNMQIAWCTQGDYTVWTPAVGNTANVRTLTEGTKLVAGRVLADFVSLVWTDAAVYRFQYTGATYVYNSSMIAKDCGLISPNAVITVGGVAYWMGQDNFYMYAGAVHPIPNVEDIRKYVFDNLKTDYGYQCNAIYNPKYNEVWFFYTINGQTNPTLGVIYNIAGQSWAPLPWGRAGGTHLTQGDTRPYMSAETGYIYQHENTLDADGAILPWSMTLSPYAMEQSKKNILVEYMVPDFFQQVGDVTLTATSWYRLNDVAALDTDTVIIPAIGSENADLRISGVYIGLSMSGNSLGSYVRLGKPVAFVKPLGET